MNSSTFNIYNASAGSGKTFTLVKEYLKILFSSNLKEPHKHILAITFTNKAVNEMKERIINKLIEFSNSNILQKDNAMFSLICDELNFSPEKVHSKSIKLLDTILHNYAAFDVSTIDKFTQRLIRTFAYDLKLPMNFEVELDTEELLNKAVENLIAKAGENKELTSLLIEFALEKADDDKSWDIAYDLKKIASLLITEKDIPYIEQLSKNTLEDFKSFKNQVSKDITEKENYLIETSNSTLEFIASCGLEFDDFNRGFLPKYFQKLAQKNFNEKYDAKWQEDIESKTLYPKRVLNNIAQTIESIQPQLADTFYKTKAAVYELRFLKNLYKNITPLSVISLINVELNTLKEEQNLLMISEFNTIISNEIKNQPAPFIYERIGEKFKHYFIDEFQDTSILQWQNLIPLLQNTLSGENGSVMLVGDAKQAIYRWRGGEANQFIDLFNHKSPFFVKGNVYNLPSNFRSFKEIISFNNSLFKHIASLIFSKEDYQNLYLEASQNTSLNFEGYVNLSFLEPSKEVHRDELFPEKVLNIIQESITNGFSLSDICVITRKKKEGVLIAEFLNDNGVDIISSETLLLEKSPEVNLIINTLSFILNQNNLEAKFNILNYIYNREEQINEAHIFYKAFIDLPIDHFFEELKTKNIFFDYKNSLQLPIYELTESIVSGFNLVNKSNAYVQFFLDFVFDYSQKYTSNISHFIEYYNSKRSSLSVVSPEGKNAVQIMTVHKSKGLEFPIVIFPYADLNIYREIEPKEWFPLDNEKYSPFTHSLLNYSKDFENYGDIGTEIYTNHQSELELDNINLLYVALTRAVEQLHIVSSKQLDKKGHENLKNYSGLFINFLKEKELWNDNKLIYEFGNPKKEVNNPIEKPSTKEQSKFISSTRKDKHINIVTSSGYLWDTAQKTAIEKGNLIHLLMSKINSEIDIDSSLNSLFNSGTINKNQIDELKQIALQIVTNNKLKKYYSSDNTTYNERDIITHSGEVLRPDRLVILPNNKAVILDYKTGKLDDKHMQQLEYYKTIVEQIGFKVEKKILIYINDSIEIKEF